MPKPHNDSNEDGHKKAENNASHFSTPPMVKTPECKSQSFLRALIRKFLIRATVYSPKFDSRLVYRHTFWVRLTHWFNVLCLPILIMSGFQIFNAHPALYLGDRSDRDRPVFSMRAVLTKDGKMQGITTLFDHQTETTGLLGVSKDSHGALIQRGFPEWATLPSEKWLSMGRRWHFFFAWLFVFNGFLYIVYSLFSGHLRRDLIPSSTDLRGIGRSILDHLKFSHPSAEKVHRYNVLQKIAYIVVLFGFGPLIVLTGLTMSPQTDASIPLLLTVFGGRQSARTIHFTVCFAFIGFIFIHLVMVVSTGFWNNLRSMLAGWYQIKGLGGKNGEQ
ncbi:MAG: cytochrome b/b6 domain-containing protein [Nitrospiria bacterium]